MRSRIGLLALALLTFADQAGAQTALSVTAGQPTGELASLEQAAEIRVRFSEPMVPIGRLPEQVTAPFFSIQPAVTGTFRWASPTLLIFTPDPKKPLPHSTRYDVSIAASAQAVSGRTPSRPFSFAFMTPTVRLLQTQWYRLRGRFNQPVVIPLRFNQAVRPTDVAAHVTVRYERHEWDQPTVSAEERARMGSDAARFDAKVAAAIATVNSEAPVPLRLATDWDKRRFPSSPDLVVLQTLAPPSPDGWLKVTVDNRLPGLEGAATPPMPQSFTIQQRLIDHVTPHPVPARLVAASPSMRVDGPPAPPSLQIVSPPDGAVYLIDPTLRRDFQTLALRATGGGPAVSWQVDGRNVGGGDFNTAIDWPLVPGRHVIAAEDTSGHSTRVSVLVK